MPLPGYKSAEESLPGLLDLGAFPTQHPALNSGISSPNERLAARAAMSDNGGTWRSAARGEGLPQQLPLGPSARARRGAPGRPQPGPASGLLGNRPPEGHPPPRRGRRTVRALLRPWGAARGATNPDTNPQTSPPAASRGKARREL